MARGILERVIAHRAGRTVLTTLLLAAGVAACGRSAHAGGNGLQAKSAVAIIRATTRAAESARSVHVSGSLNQGGTTIALDLRMVAGVGASGWMSDGGRHFALVLDHSTLYISGGSSFWNAFGNASIAKRLRGKWLKTPATGDYASIAKFASLRRFFQQIFSETTGPVAKADARTIDDQRTIGVRDVRKIGVLYVATSGKPYPVEIDGASTSRSGTTGKLDFSGFNARVAIRAPKHSISVARLEHPG